MDPLYAKAYGMWWKRYHVVKLFWLLMIPKAISGDFLALLHQQFPLAHYISLSTFISVRNYHHKLPKKTFNFAHSQSWGAHKVCDKFVRLFYSACCERDLNKLWGRLQQHSNYSMAYEKNNCILPADTFHWYNLAVTFIIL